MSGRIYETCPFNPSHVYKSTRKEIHLQKCQLNHINEGYVRCIFNYNHIIKNDLKLKHLKECDAADEDVCNLILRISNAKVRYNEIYGKDETPNGSARFDNETDIHTKVKHWLENTSDPITHDEIYKSSARNSIVCNEDNSLPLGYDPHECQEIEEYYRNLRKASDKQCSSKSCPRPLRTANHFIKAELENCKKLSSEGTSDSISDTSINSSVPRGSVHNLIRSKNASKHPIKETCQKNNESSSNVLNKHPHHMLNNSLPKCQNKVDNSVVSLTTTASYKSSFLYPKHEQNYSENVLPNLSYYLTNIPTVCPEDSISNVGVTNTDHDRKHIDLNSLVSESAPLDLESIVSNEICLIKTKKPLAQDTDSFASRVSSEYNINKKNIKKNSTSSDMDSLISQSVLFDVQSMLSCKVTSKQKEIENPRISSDSLISEAVPFDFKSMLSSKVTSKQKEIISSDIDPPISEPVPLDVKAMISSKVTSKQKEIQECVDTDSLIDTKSVISSCSFLTANNDTYEKKTQVFTKSENKPKTRSVSVQTEGICNCHAPGLRKREFY